MAHMDTIHDLGGKQGFGPIPVKTGDAPFTHDWERRMWGLARAGIAHDITIDWFRHGIERMVPADYLTFAYFNKWATNYLMLIIDNGRWPKRSRWAPHRPKRCPAGHVDKPDTAAALSGLSLAEVAGKKPGRPCQMIRFALDTGTATGLRNRRCGR